MGKDIGYVTLEGAPRAGARPIVEVCFRGNKIGLYRVHEVGDRTLVLGHGGISFPVGTELVIEDVHRLLPGSPVPRLPARVVQNDARGIAVAW